MTLNVLAPYRTVWHFIIFVVANSIEGAAHQPENWNHDDSNHINSYDQWSNEPVNLRHLT